MNTLIFKITENIMYNNITEISLAEILSKNINYINEYINEQNRYWYITVCIITKNK